MQRVKITVEVDGEVVEQVHLLLQWRTDESLATLIRRVKANSSRWVHAEFPMMQSFAWQEGYAAFTVSPSQSDTVSRYIQNQAAHRRQHGLVEELRALLEAHGVEYDERHLRD